MKRKKRPRSQVSAKEKKQIDEDSWRAALEDISINDDNWWCIATMMVETVTEHSKCVSLFNIAAEEGTRKAIYSLSYQKMLSAVRVLSKHDLNKCPTVQGVCHYASKVLSEDKGMLPTWLIARIIKFLIYRAKEDTIGIVKRLADLEREVDEEYQIMQTVADWGQPRSKGFDAEKFNNKANTRLRKCNEEWRDAIYVDDAPLNGPNLFIILSGFHDPDLPEHLISAGVPLSFILPIKRSNKELDRLARYETARKEPLEIRSLLHFESYESSGFDLFKFWSTIETRVMNPQVYPALCDVAFVTFRPPKLPNVYDDDQYESLRKDMYDRVSYFLYDLYDLYRQHTNYLKAMRIEENIVDRREEKHDTNAYETFLDAVPQECVSVPVILFAMLVQIEASEQASNEESVDEKGDANTIKRTSADAETKPENTKQSLVSFVEEKLKALNVKFDLDDEHNANEKEPTVTDIELILREDILNETIRLLDDSANFHVPSRSDLIDNILLVFWHPNITSLHSEHEISETKLEEYSRHIDKTRCYFDVKMSNEEVGHYLHILMFDKMIFGKPRRQNDTSKDRNETGTGNSMNFQSSLHSMKLSKSAPSLSSKFDLEINFHSDGNIDYGKFLPTLVNCSPLFDLIDPRELLIPGYLKENLFDARCKDGLNLDEFDDVEPLTKSIFLQSLHRCLLSFDNLKIRYFEPTDSVLLCFENQWKVNGVDEEERISNIRTPVRLRDFCEYVVAEEEDWLRREEEIYRLQTSESMGRLMKKAVEIHDETLLFRDEDFILPWSLKAGDLQNDVLVTGEKQSDAGTRSPSTDEETTERSKKGKGKKRKATKKGKQKGKKPAVDEESTSTAKKSPSFHDGETAVTYEFIGYDLGKQRVHVTNRKKTFFSDDGTLVRVEVDDWLYKNKDLRITVTLRGYSLRLYHGIDVPESSTAFHLTSSRGIILAFQKLLKSEDTTKDPFKNYWSDSSIEFRASWPTGLLIEPIIGDSKENPFYIRQSYIPKGCNSTNGVSEVCRKFLRNGTVLKYLDNGKIIVLRPNGDIVTCITFEKLRVNEDEKTVEETYFAKGDRPSRGSKLPSKSKRKPTRSSKSQLPGVVEQNPGLAQQDSTTVNQVTVKFRFDRGTRMI
ncbi:sperm-associated antigen 17-like [Colletes gigas]|uniref:sperm-associated antigen 17-like n=1 Tax=Colletes gigas TaxID=935657 RepID=UPI001C9ADDAB|nr:sperm-associated antigen 17-like [Colletes gigas]